jgi:transposase-like protein
MNLIDFQTQFPNEVACLEYLEQQHWCNGRYCPHCGSYETYKFKDGRLFKCVDCKKQFTVKVGTIFSDSHIPLQKWFYAVFLNTSLKKGISSIQLGKYLGITQKSAWFMLQRIRYSMSNSSFDIPLEGIVEVDETYVGGKQSGKGRGPVGKQVIFGAVERGGRAKLKHVPSSGARALLPEIAKSISPGAIIYSDQYAAYKTLDRRGYSHESVNHSQLEFARGGIHTNTIEGGVWDHLKLSLSAIYIGVSPKHLQKYCDEFDFRYNTRELNDGQRFGQWFKFINGKQLSYKELIG